MNRNQNQRERARVRHIEWRQSMSTSQRAAFLARRRQRAQGKRPAVESIADVNTTPYDLPFDVGPSNRPQVSDVGPSNAAPYDDIGPSSRAQVPGMRLTHLRRLARSGNSGFICNPGILEDQNLTEHGFSISRMNGLEEQHNFDGMSNYDFEYDSDSDGNTDHEGHNVQNVQCIRRPRISCCSARNFHESRGIPAYLSGPLKTCPYCDARLFVRETFSMCCLNGGIAFPLIQSPPEMFELFSDQSDEGRRLKKDIRPYNNAFAFTSLGVHLDNTINVGRGVFTFRAQGSIYHRIGGLLPNEGVRPRYLQSYIYDTDHEVENRLSDSEVLDRRLIEKIQRILNLYNPFVRVLRSLGQRQDLPNIKLIIKEQPKDRHQYSMPSASQVAAIIVGSGIDINPRGRDCIVQTLSGALKSVFDSKGYYDPLQYPLLFPHGTYGWDINTRDNNGNKVTCCDYYSYMLQMRQGDTSLLLRGGRLLQQYVVDMYVKIETMNLRFLRRNQDKFRKEIRRGLHDSLLAGENNASNVGRRTILPSSFIGSPRDMYQRYQDAMALVQKYGRPDFFITMTCNPNWEEVRRELFPGQTSQDRPDLLTRVFREKVEQLKQDIINKGVLGRVIAHTYVIEFQKRGLPHLHMLIILDENDKLNNPDDYDQVVLAEIPDENVEPQLYNAVLKHMIHGPCGALNPRSPCMKDGQCKKNFPKAFSNMTKQGNDSYPIYRRRDGRPPVNLLRHGEMMVDNSWVVPYNPWLLLRYDCHINVEVCGSIKSVKYLYKYVYKGSDRVALEVQSDQDHDEIKQFVDARWICAPEALWRIYKFIMNKIYPTVERLQIHLPNEQWVRFNVDRSIEDLMADERLQKTKLTEFFSINRVSDDARNYLYRELPEGYRWDNKYKQWRKRRRKHKVVGRIYTVSPSEGEKFYLRVLLNHVRGPLSFEDLATSGGVLQPTFKQAAEKRGLLEQDNSVRRCLLEASAIRMPSALRQLFVTILVYCEPIGVRSLWEEFYPFMVEDYLLAGGVGNNSVQNRLLRELNRILEQFDKNISKYDLPALTNEVEFGPRIPRCIQDELAVPVPQEDIDAIEHLNHDQRLAFNTIMDAVEQNEPSIFFVDGPGGTGKTYLYRALLAKLRAMYRIVLATATSGIAACILPGGRTAHSTFKIPIDCEDSSSICSISKQSDLAMLIKAATAIIWDEATMTHRIVFEALDRSFRDITGVDLPFGGKLMIFGGDFRQVLPVVRKGTKSELIQASIMKTSFWSRVNILRLRHNMRSMNDQRFAEFLLRVGNGDEDVVSDEMIKIPEGMVIPWESDRSIDQLIEHVFPNLDAHVSDARYMVDRAIITPINDDVAMLNDKIIRMFPGQEITMYSFDSVEDDIRNLYQPEFLNSITFGGLPPHMLTLKRGAPIMLLRNIDHKLGLCNGTRLLCRGVYQNLLDAEILTGQFAGTRVFIPRIPIKTKESIGLPFKLIRKQFPVKLSFSLTINKSQGQTIPHVGVYLPDHVFSHGQLYVALSRGVSESTTKVLVQKGSIAGEQGTHTKNVVYKEVLLRTETNDFQ